MSPVSSMMEKGLDTHATKNLLHRLATACLDQKQHEEAAMLTMALVALGIAHKLQSANPVLFKRLFKEVSNEIEG